MKLPNIRTAGAVALLAATILSLSACGGDDAEDQGSVPSSVYAVTPLVVDANANGLNAPVQDPHLINPWGIAFNPTGFVWVTNNGNATSTLYDGKGTPQTLVVTTPAAPTGIVFYGGTNFVVSGTNAAGAAVTGPSRFIFATEGGQIAAWAPAVTPTSTTIMFDGSAAKKSYKGLATATQGTATFLYATDFRNAKVDVFDSSFKPVSPGGSFTDPSVPAGYAPFGIQTIGNRVFVTYAKQNADASDSVNGRGLGAVSVYDLTGVLVTSFANGGALNSPWGLTQAPANFGAYSNAILVGNFGDGMINAYDATTGKYLGALRNATGSVVQIDGLWGLAFGNDRSDQPSNALFATAGAVGEKHGTYNRVDAK